MLCCKFEPSFDCKVFKLFAREFFVFCNIANDGELWRALFTPFVFKLHGLILQRNPFSKYIPIVIIITQILNSFSFSLIKPIVYNQILKGFVFLLFLIFLLNLILNNNRPSINGSNFSINIARKEANPFTNVFRLKWFYLHRNLLFLF